MCVVSAPHFSLDCLGNSRLSPEIRIKWTVSRKPSWTCPALTWAHPQTAPTLCWPHLSVVEAEKQQENPTTLQKEQVKLLPGCLPDCCSWASAWAPSRPGTPPHCLGSTLVTC